MKIVIRPFRFVRPTKRKFLVGCLMMSPVIIVGLLTMLANAPKARAYSAPPQFRILFYPNCSPAWAGGTIWPTGIAGGLQSGDGITVGPYCGGPAYVPGMMPYIVAPWNNTIAQMVIDTATNYCGQGTIPLGYCYTESDYHQVGGFGIFEPVPGTTNVIAMPNGCTSCEWNVGTTNIPGWGTVPIIVQSSSVVYCPGGVGTGGQ